MEPNYQQPTDLFNEQRPLPNATATLVLGILSIVVCFVCGIVALIISSADKRMYEENPHLYSASSYETMKAGRICAIIGLCIVGIGIFFFMIFMVFFAASFASINN